MAKLTFKIALPIIIAGFFATGALLATGREYIDPSFYFLLFCLLVFVFFFGLAAGQRAVSPVKKILQKANELSEGNLSSRIDLETKDELSELAKIFNKLAEELQESREREANAEKSISIKVKARTQEFQETINALEQKVKNRTIELERLLAQYKKMQSDAASKNTAVKQE